MARIMVLDDDQDFLQAASGLLEAMDHKVTTVNSLGAARQILKTNRFDHLLLDLMLPDGSGLQLLDALSDKRLENTKVTVVTGHPSIKQSVKSLYGPSVNYLLKPITLATLEAALSDDLPQPEAAPSSTVKPSANESVNHHQGIVGQSPQIKQLISTIERVASTDANILLMGESGSGKEVVSQAIHVLSRAHSPMVAANCAALSKELINSELFGHEKGAFTGAIARKAGVFEQAQDGTLFLDEITEMPLDLQSNLLRVLESNEFNRVGGSELLPVRCRVISATNRSEASLANDQCLREDLYFRLAVFPIHIPPLREREGDISILAQHFLNQLNKQHDTEITFKTADLERLEQYDWPGNVRELRHCIHRAFIMTDPETNYLSVPERLGSPFSRKQEDPSDFQLKPGQSIEQMERALIKMTLDKLDGDRGRAAKMLGVSTKTLYNRLKSYEAEQTEPSS